MIEKIGITQAIMSLRPKAQWTLKGNEYDGLDWLDDVQTKPTEEEINEEIKRLTKEYEDTQYQRDRAKEYPSFLEYIDGIVKGDAEQVQKYIDDCLAVKVRYPKPEIKE
jgi:hypothetical protein